MFSLDAMIPVRHLVYVLLSVENVEILRRICWCRAALDSVAGTLHNSSRSSVPRKAIACASSGFGPSFFSSKEAKIMHRGFTGLPGMTDASAHPTKLFTQLKAPATFPTESFSKQFRFLQSTFPSKEATHVKENRTT